MIESPIDESTKIRDTWLWQTKNKNKNKNQVYDVAKQRRYHSGSVGTFYVVKGEKGKGRAENRGHDRLHSQIRDI